MPKRGGDGASMLSSVPGRWSILLTFERLTNDDAGDHDLVSEPDARNGPSAGGGLRPSIGECPWAGRAILAATRRLTDIRSRPNWRTTRLIPRDNNDRDDKHG